MAKVAGMIRIRKEYFHEDGSKWGVVVLTIYRDSNLQLISLHEDDTRQAIGGTGWLYRKEWDGKYGLSRQKAEQFIERTLKE